MEQLWRKFGDLVPAVLVGVPVLVLVAWGLAAWRMRRMETGRAWRRSVLDVLLVASVLPVLYLVLVPVDFQETRVRLVPGSDVVTVHDMTSVWQLVGNLVMLAPLGALAPLRWPWLRSMGRVVLVAVAAACGIELVQWVFDLGRAVTTDDALVNALGAVLGAAASRPWWSTTRRARSTAHPDLAR